MFWGLEEYFHEFQECCNQDGYANGQVETTSTSCSRKRDHAETVQVIYDENECHLEIFTPLLFPSHRPLYLSTSKGNDRGRQYRTGIYYQDEQTYLSYLHSGAGAGAYAGSKDCSERWEKLRHYILAEDYHQDYLKKNPSGYCHIDVSDAENLD